MTWIDKLFRQWGVEPNARKRSRRPFRPGCETLEDRFVPAVDFIQGVAFVDANGNSALDPGEIRKAGATIGLTNLAGGLTTAQVTDGDGYYRFSNLAAGTYRLTELDAVGYTTAGVQASTLVSTTSNPTVNSIDVTIGSTPTPLYLNRLPGAAGGVPGVDTAYTLNGGPFNQYTEVPYPSNAHQYEANLSGGSPETQLTANFYAYCVDLFHANPDRFQVTPDSTPVIPASAMPPLSATTAANVGRLGYLYNTYGRFLQGTGVEQAGLQLAVWELLYDASPNLNAGNFQVLSTTSPAAVTAAENYLNLSAGKSQGMLFLNVLNSPAGSLGSQGMTGTELINFVNVPTPPPPPAVGDIDIEKYVKVVENTTPGGEGLTPGYWKQTHHFSQWTGYSPSDSFEQVFGVDVPGVGSGFTLLQALSTGGGEYLALNRHAVAGLLNSTHAGINYLYSTSQVISMVQQAYASGSYEATKNLLAAQNELEADLSTPRTSAGGGSAAGFGEDADSHPGLRVEMGDTLQFTFVVTNPGTVTLGNVVVRDDNQTPNDPTDDFNPTPVLIGGYNVGDANKNNRLEPTEQWLFTATRTVTSAGDYCNTATVTGTPVDSKGKPIGGTVTDTDVACYNVRPDDGIDIEKLVKLVGTTGGGEGLTPGFWKQTQHFYAWTGYTQSQSFEAVFGVSVPGAGSPTLLEALGTGGGGYEALNRHAVAALLNASNPNVSYAYTAAQVVSMVRQAYATGNYDATKNLFQTQNEKGADLSTAARSTPGSGEDADTAPGLYVGVGATVQFTYVVTNTGTSALKSVVVRDDNGTPDDPTDDYAPTPVLAGGYNVGDANKNNLLDPGEQWQYAATEAVADEGTRGNIGSVSAAAVGSGVLVADADAAYYTGVLNPAAATKFYVVDRGADAAFGYGAEGGATSSAGLAAGNTDPRDVASNAAGTTLWVIDSNLTVYVYSAAGALLGSWKTTGLTKPEGIATDGTNLWVVDFATDRVYYFAGGASRLGGTAGATSSFALAAGNTNPYGVATDGVSLWVVDDGKNADKVFKYTVGGAALGSWTIDKANGEPRGITIDPNNVGDVWIVDSRKDSVYQYVGAASRTSGSQSANGVFNLAPGNTDPQGIVDPMPAGAASTEDDGSVGRVGSPVFSVIADPSVQTAIGSTVRLAAFDIQDGRDDAVDTKPDAPANKKLGNPTARAAVAKTAAGYSDAIAALLGDPE